MITACRDALPLMSDYLEGALAEPTRVAFEGHLGICPRCREVLRSLEIVPAIVSRATEVDAPDGLADEIVERLRTTSSRS